LEKQIAQLNAKDKPEQSNNFIFDGASFLKFWLVGLFLVFVSYIFYQSLNIIFLIIAAFIISVAIEAIIEFFQKRI